MADIVYIYGLREPGTNIIRYIGSTKNIRARVATHVSGVGVANPAACGRWIASMVKRGAKPEPVVIEEVNEANRLEREQYWIGQYKGSGFLLNAIHYMRKSIAPNRTVLYLERKHQAILKKHADIQGVHPDEILRQVIDLMAR